MSKEDKQLLIYNSRNSFSLLAEAEGCKGPEVIYNSRNSFSLLARAARPTCRSSIYNSRNSFSLLAYLTMCNNKLKSTIVEIHLAY